MRLNASTQTTDPAASRDICLSFVRFVATLLIVLCHILQHYGYWTAFWFNCGVQIFIFISGFIFGQKEIRDDLKFIVKRLCRILLDYYVCLPINLLILYLVSPKSITWNGVSGLLFFNSTIIPALGHLWFIPTICFLYIITPLLKKIITNLEQFLAERVRSKGLAKVLFFSILFILFMWIPKFIGPLSLVNCWIYTLGLLAGRRHARNPESKAWLNWGLIIALPASFIGTTACILHEQCGRISFFTRHPRLYTDWFYPFNHAALGIALFCVLYLLEARFGFFRRAGRLAELSDKYSYDVYLTHHLWIQNPVSLFNLPYAFILKLIMVMVVIAIQTVFVRSLSERINKAVRQGLQRKLQVS